MNYKFFYLGGCAQHSFWMRVVCLFVFSLSHALCGATYQGTKKELRDGYLATADLLIFRAEHRVWKAWKKLNIAGKGAYGPFPLSGAMLVLYKPNMLKRIDALVTSTAPGAQELLDGVLEYYKALLSANYLRAAYAQGLEVGEAALGVEGVFTQLFDAQEKGCGEYQPDIIRQQANFIKFVMELTARARFVWWQPRSFRATLHNRVDEVLDWCEGMLPRCVGSDEHVASTCHRCCATNLLQSLSQGIIQHGVWNDPCDSYVFEKTLITSSGLAFVLAVTWLLKRK